MEISIERQKQILTHISTVMEHFYNIKGICGALTQLYDMQKISITEYCFMKAFINKNKPTPNNEYAQFMYNEVWNFKIFNSNDFDSMIGGYWWKAIDKLNPITTQIRIDYIQTLINNLK